MGTTLHVDREPSVAFSRFRRQERQLDLISLHVPKAFGTSIRDVLVHHYGRRRVTGDYARFLEDVGVSNEDVGPPDLPRSTAVVHGHFPAIRDAGVPARRRVAFLRDPIARTISHYFFWLNEPPHGNPVHDRMLAEKSDLLTFASLPEIRWFYSRTIFGGADLASFDLIGVVERLDRDWPRFQSLTGITAELPHLNRNRYPAYAEAVSRARADDAGMQALHRLLDDDMRFYRRFL